MEKNRLVASATARPAVYTREKTSLRERILSHVPTGLSALPAIPLPLVIIVIVGLSVAIVYGPARNYYTAWRDAGILQAQYDVLVSQNGELTHAVDRLHTVEGIEDEARRRGYAYPDEEAIVVEGLEEEQLADPSLVDKAIEDHEQSLPWYVSALDAVFGYQLD